MQDPTGGRARRRRLSLAERQELFARADGRCQRCGGELGIDWQGAHLNAWSRGGATELANMEAWCRECNLSVGAHDVGHLDVQPRGWQEDALPIVVDTIFESGVATIQAAPGAGKTIFAGLVFLQLLRAGVVDRMIVVVPRANLITQWRRSLGDALRLHLDDEPRDNYLEHPDTLGCIVSYQSLPGAANGHRTLIDRSATLVVLDEVHHVGEAASWGNAVDRMVGDVNATDGIAAAGVLNLTGTLFRSKKSSRISTVRYRDVAEGKIEARADYTIQAAQLIQEGHLRKPVLYRMGATAQVVNLETAEVVSGDIADLDKRMAKAAIRQSFTSEEWLRGFIVEALAMLTRAQQAIGHDAEALKLLFVASDQKAARVAADLLNDVVGRDFARLVISDQVDARNTLDRVIREDRPSAIVSCQMITEGFDHPPVAVIAYASHFMADLFVAQMMARAMRVTSTERGQRKMLPAQILIPDNTELVAAFEAALIGQMHILEVNDDQIIAEPAAIAEGLPRPRLFELIDLEAPELARANVLGEEEGEVLPLELEETGRALQSVGVPEVYTAQIVVASRKIRHFPRIYSEPETPRPRPTSEPMNARQLNKLLRSRVNVAVRWWYPHITHSQFNDFPHLQAEVNKAMGVRGGHRDNASREQLAAGYAWLVDRIVQHCAGHDETPPSWIEHDVDGEAP